MIRRHRKHAGATLLGLAIERDRIDAVELRRTNGSSEIRRSTSVALESDPLTMDAESLGRLIRHQLDQAGIRETRCAVALPPHAVLPLTLEIPPHLSKADRLSFIETEAERGFPQSPDQLMLQTSGATEGSEASLATILAVNRESMERLDAGLRAARLLPTSISLGLSLLCPPESSSGADATGGAGIDLVPSGTQLGLMLRVGTSVAALRAIEDVFSLSPESGHPDGNIDLVAREIRITLGPLPAQVRDTIRSVRVVGPSETAASFAKALSPRLAALGLEVHRVPEIHRSHLPFRLPTHAPAVPALAAAVQGVSGLAPEFEFQPPRITPWQQFSSRYASRRVAWTGIAAGAIAATVLLLFSSQQYMLWRWQSRWNAMKTDVTRIEAMQREIARYSPWFNDSVRSLSILRRITEAFPEDGSVSAKSIELRGPFLVSCSGTARNRAAWLEMLDRISSFQGVRDVKVEQSPGTESANFSFSFRWEGEPRS